jgi:hypothetical protein
LLQYQWGQSNLTTETGTPITPNSTDTSPSPPSDNPTSSSQDQTGVSPDDGYTTSGIGQDGVQSVNSFFIPICATLTNLLPQQYNRSSRLRHKISGKMQASDATSYLLLVRHSRRSEWLFDILWICIPYFYVNVTVFPSLGQMYLCMAPAYWAFAS